MRKDYKVHASVSIFYMVKEREKVKINFDMISFCL